MASIETNAVLDGEASVEGAAAAPRFSDTMLLTASQVVKWGLRLVFVVVVARELGPEWFGVYALLFAMVEFLAVASGSGYADYLTREAAKDPRAGWGLALQLILLRIAIAIPIAAIEIGILSFMRYPHAVLAGTAWMALTLAPRALSEAVQGVLRGIHRYASYLVTELVLGGSLVAGAGLLLIRRGGLSMVIATEIVAAGAAGLAGLGFALKFKTREQIWLSCSHLVKRSAIFNVYSFVGSLYDRFDVVLLSKLAGDYATGIYSIAYRALSMTQILGYGVLYSLLPSLSRGPWDRSQQQQLERAMGLLLNASFIVVLTTIVFATPAVRLVLGSRYAESAMVLKILIWAVILRYLNYSLNIALLAAGRERVFVVTASVCLAVNFIGNLVLIPMYSWRASAVLTIVTDLVSVIQNARYIRATIGRVPRPFGMVRSSLAFMALLTITIAGGRVFDPIVVGTVCLLLFLIFLKCTGMLNEFANIWHAESGPLAKLSP